MNRYRGRSRGRRPQCGLRWIYVCTAYRGDMSVRRTKGIVHAVLLQVYRGVCPRGTTPAVYRTDRPPGVPMQYITNFQESRARLRKPDKSSARVRFALDKNEREPLNIKRRVNHACGCSSEMKAKLWLAPQDSRHLPEWRLFFLCVCLTMIETVYGPI